VGRDEVEELIDGAEAQRRRVVELSEAIGDCRARRLQQDSVIARLREELRDRVDATEQSRNAPS
jgi:hypothetical protein